MSKPRKKKVITLRIAAVLLILIMLSTSIVAGQYARYTTSATVGDSARVAKYQISVTPLTEDALTVKPDTPDSYDFAVLSNSEVAVEYDILLILPEGLPEGISPSLMRGGLTLTQTTQNNTYSWETAGAFPAGGGTHEYSLIFAADAPVGADTLKNIVVRVDARQVD